MSYLCYFSYILKQGSHRCRLYKPRLCCGGGRSCLVIENGSSLFKWVSSKTQSPFFRRSCHHNEGEFPLLPFIFLFFTFDFFTISGKRTKSQQNVTMSVGSAAVCFGKVWEFHNYLEDGKIGWVLFIFKLKNFRGIFVNKYIYGHFYP